MAYERAARKRGSGWIIALPGEVRRWLKITHRTALYWHATRAGEAVLTTTGERKAGRPEVTRLTRDLAAARKEIDAIRQRDQFHDRGVYAEGFTHGYLQAYERLMHPLGASAERGRRRALYRWAFPDAAHLTDPKQAAPRPAPGPPRHNARTRRAKRDEALAPRAVEVHSLDRYPAPPPSPSPASSEEGADTSGAQLPGVPLEY